MEFEKEENNINSITVYKDKQSIVNLKQTSKKKILFQKVLFTSILIIILICVLLILFKKKEKQKVYPTGEDSNPESIDFTEEKNNSIKAIYSLKKKKNCSYINKKKSTSPKTSMS